MSSPEPRRSQRDRKQAKPFISGDAASGFKRKRSDDLGDTDPDTGLLDGESDLSSLSDENHSDDNGDIVYVARKQSKPKTKPAENGKPKVAKDGTPTTKARGRPKGQLAARRKKKGDDVDINAIVKETAISDDNVLFNAILNPAAALQSTAEDWLESFNNSPGTSLAELIMCILRACGCNASIDQDEVMDVDGVVEFLSELVEEFKKGTILPYPLVSKLTAFRKFRKSLSEFFHRLIQASAESGALYEADFIPTLSTWVIAMSSAQLRSFRHTATVVALEVESALALVAVDVDKESETVGRQREGEKKRKGKGAGGGRDKDLEKKAAEIKERRDQLMEYLQEFFDGVFIHRYRDHDAGIRGECVKELGVWFKTYPAHFLHGNYLRYIGWVLSDKDTHVRLEAVKSLGHLYTKEDYISTLRSFTERFKPRLIAMATSDIDVSVRVTVIQVLSTIDSQGLLEEEQRETLCLLVFDTEPRVRKAVSGFVKGVWEEAVEEKLVGRRGGDKELDQQRAGVKCLATLLLKWSRLLEKRVNAEAADTQDDESESKPQEIADLVDAAGNISSASAVKGRIGLCVEALWGEVDAVKEWTALLDHLLLDHTSDLSVQAGVASPAKRRAKRGVKAAKAKGKDNDDDEDDDRVEEIWRLDEREESLLIEVLLASLKKVRIEGAAKKKVDEEVIVADMTRVLINALPKLFAKNKTDEGRIADIVLIPQVMNLDLYLEMRMITAYEALWDDITKHFLSHTSPTVLHNTITTIRYLLETTSLSNTNGAKIIELEDELSTSLRDAVAGREELEVAEFSEDEVRVLGGVVARLATLVKIRDMCSWTEEDEGGKQSSAWDIISAVADRGRFGYREEETLVRDALQFLALHIFWKSKALTSEDEPSADQLRIRDSLKEQREALLAKATEFALGKDSNVSHVVKRAAFHQLLSIHILFSPMDADANDERRKALNQVKLTLSEQDQIYCAGFIEAEIETYVRELELSAPEAQDGAATDQDDVEQNDSDEDEGVTTKKTKKAKRGKGAKASIPSETELEREYILASVVSTFGRAIRTGVIDIARSVVLLAHYGQLGVVFDQWVKVIVEVLREEGMYNGNGQAVVDIVTRSLEESCTLHLDGLMKTEEHTVALAKALLSSFVIRGAHLSITRRLASEHVVEIHKILISWVLKRIAAYDKNNNKAKRATALAFFRALIQLLATIQSRDALKIKNHLDSSLTQTGLEVPSSAKVWEPLRAYEKRLVTAMSRDKAIVSKSKKVQDAKKSADMVSSDDEVQRLVSREGSPMPASPTNNRKAGRPSNAMGADEDVFGTASASKKERPRPRPKPRAKAVGVTNQSSPERETSKSSPARPPRTVTPNVSPTKRKRVQEETEGEDDADGEPAEDDGMDEDLPRGKVREKPSSQESHISVADMKSRRKRTRR